MKHEHADICIIGGTPAGIMAAVAAAREGMQVIITEDGDHIGGLPANGLGATDIGVRGATAGLFGEFVARVRAHYAACFGEDSAQVHDCSDGYHFEPKVAERVLRDMLRECESRITVLLNHRFHCLPRRVEKRGRRILAVTLEDRLDKDPLSLQASVFVDATYEGDLMAAAGVRYCIGREAADVHGEPMAGVLYQGWREPLHPASTFAGDNRIQAFNYRLCLTRDPANRIPFRQPDHYCRDAYISLIEDVLQNRWAGKCGNELFLDGIGRITNMVILPNAKTDANNQHLAFISTDLPEENQPWPEADWNWREAFARRLREYTEGLLWFASNDPALPSEFRQRCAQWGFAADEYTDNGGFPRHVYVREGRRMQGRYVFTAHDALPLPGQARPRVHADSVTASCYSLDSHAVRKREPDRPHLEGFFNYPIRVPYTVPYRVMLPQELDNLLVPVAVSGTHVGFSTLRMEPCWMALGHAAGLAASLAMRRHNADVAAVVIAELQEKLRAHGAVLEYPVPA